MRWSALLLALTLLNTGPGGAGQSSPYRDDRSTPTSVLRSLYSALNRQEYTRAYSYWLPGPPGPPPYRRFVTGYADTLSVALSVGPAQSEGAAGSVYTTVPVRLRVVTRSGQRQTFSGCYLLRQVQPALQEPPFRPIGIVSRHLRVAEASAPRPGRALCAGIP